MSGIVGLVNLDGAPIERDWLLTMTRHMACRGPDAQDIWIDGPVGLGHTLLRATDESATEHQPFSLDGQVWITADARIDGRKELQEKLSARDRSPLSAVPDVELILRAYLLWKEDCLRHLIGDFAFAIWDGPQQQLFCARDHFGIKPFYFARLSRCFLCSNTLNCLRLHPRVSSRLNERAIGDYLLFAGNRNPATTTFADIQRLPAGHSLRISADHLHGQRFWSLSIPEQIRYRRQGDYLEHFKACLKDAVADRLRTEKIAIWFSGGLDSPMLAATALDFARKSAQALDIQGFTLVYDRLIPDQERYYSSLAAEALGMTRHCLPMDDYELYEGWDRPELQKPEPSHGPLAISEWDHLRQTAAHSRVVLYGQGADEAFWHTSVANLIPTMPAWNLLMDLCRCLCWHRRIPPIGSGVLAAFRRWYRKDETDITYPDWLREDFAARLDLPARWQELTSEKCLKIHTPRAAAFSRLSCSTWADLFESCDAGVTQVPLEFRAPYLDVRLLSFLLALPPIPWCVDKQMLRASLRGRMPKQIWRRPKTPLAGEPMAAYLARGQRPWAELANLPELNQYINIPKILSAAQGGMASPGQVWEWMRLVSLGRWLQQQHQRNLITNKVCLQPV